MALSLKNCSLKLARPGAAQPWCFRSARRTNLRQMPRAFKLPDSFPRLVDSIPRRGDVTIPEFHVFQQPRSSELLRLIFPEGHAAWPGIILVAVTLAVLAEAILALTGRVKHQARQLAPEDAQESLLQQQQQQQQEQQRQSGSAAGREQVSLPQPLSSIQQQLVSDGWDDWGGPCISADGPASTAVSAAQQGDGSESGVDSSGRGPKEPEGSWAVSEEAARKARAQQEDWELHHLSREMHDERNRGLLWLAAVTLVALWATGILSLPAHDPLDASA